MLTTKRYPRRGRRLRRVRLQLEGLESRCLLSAPGRCRPTPCFTKPSTRPSTSNRSASARPRPGRGDDRGRSARGGRRQLVHVLSVGDCGSSPDCPAGAGPNPLAATLSLYNDAPQTYDPATFSYIDPYTPDGHRLLAQDDGGAINSPARAATIDRILGPGTYWVAVSGSGNDNYYPYLAGSGLDGRTGSYRLLIATSDAGSAYDDPSVPVVLASDPAPGEFVGQSPFVLRFDLNAPLSPDTVAGYNNDPTTLAQLLFNTTNDFSAGGSATDVTYQYLPFATVALEPQANELQIALGRR